MIAFIAFTVAVLLTAGLVLAAPALGWFDGREGLEHRKPGVADIPVVGGAAILGAMIVADRLDPTLFLPWPALAGAFLLGLVDDVRRGGLSPAVKLAGQITVATLLVMAPGPGFQDHSAVELLTIAAVALVAMNAVNLFDHADAMAGTACCVALGPGAPALAAAVGGYLPFNILFRRRKTFRESVPMTMLGDSGTHLLGVAVAVTPGAAWLLLVPLLDAGRVVIGRLSRGAPFWEGDRTHLGNRLVAIGLSPVDSALVVVLLVAPPLAVQSVFGEAWPGWAGFAVSAALYALAVRLTRGFTGPSAAQPVEGGPPVYRAGPDRSGDGLIQAAAGSRAGEGGAQWEDEWGAEGQAAPSTPRWTVVRRRAGGSAPAHPAQDLAPTASIISPDGEEAPQATLPAEDQVGRKAADERVAAEPGPGGRHSHPLTGSLRGSRTGSRSDSPLGRSPEPDSGPSQGAGSFEA